MPRWTARDVCRERYLQEQVDVGRSWGISLPLLDLTPSPRQPSQPGFGAMKELARTESDLTEMTVANILRGFVIVLLLKKLVILITQFLRISAKVLTKNSRRLYVGCIRPNAWWPTGPHAGDRG